LEGFLQSGNDFLIGEACVEAVASGNENGQRKQQQQILEFHYDDFYSN
jgi:hypothetical protein